MADVPDLLPRQPGAKAWPTVRIAVLAGLLMGAAGGAQAQPKSTPAPTPSRGQLLYAAHCIECHTAQMHWRADRQATDWETLRAQVRRWQGTAGLGWSDTDIDDVARHLNDTIYRYALPQQQASRADARRRER